VLFVVFGSSADQFDLFFLLGVFFHGLGLYVWGCLLFLCRLLVFVVSFNIILFFFEFMLFKKKMLISQTLVISLLAMVSEQKKSVPMEKERLRKKK
jgi:hypothetical protein